MAIQVFGEAQIAKDEGGVQLSGDAFNFIGAAVSAVRNATTNVVDVTISALASPASYTENFTGAGPFVLARTPASSTAVELKVNGHGQINGTDFTVSGTTVTWAVGADFTLAAGDEIEIQYTA